MRRVKIGLDKMLEAVVGTILGLLVLDVAWQVLARYVVRLSTPWTEELAMFLMIWLSLLGACVAYRRGVHLGIDAMVACFSPRTQIRLGLLAHFLVILFAVGVMIVGGASLVYNTFLTHQYSPAMGIRMGYVYLAMPISGVFMLVDGLEFIYQICRSLQTPNREERC